MAAPKNPSTRGQQRDKPFRDALRMEITAAGDDLKQLRKVARALIAKASEGDVPAIKEVADRLDGKPAQESTVTVNKMDKDVKEWTRAEIAEYLDHLREQEAQIISDKPAGEAVH